MPNKLANETSPYLRQHQDNPVNWYPWGAEALSLAKQENKPIFLSIGYAACHWCHVMAHESFEDPETAIIMNENFICIKVDREERPDLDDIYMQAVVILTGHGGWPMSVFLTPDLKPFYGGTYFPPIPRHGLPSFVQILTSVINVWKSKPTEVIHHAQTLTEAIQTQHTHSTEIGREIDLDSVVNTLHNAYDWREGGWGGAPKFPQPMVIEFLLQRALLGDEQALKVVNHALTTMARGGMYDLVGGGFHRYSTDAAWLVPHFEKMLYDNALLASVYLHGFALTGRQFFLDITTETLNFIQRELTSPEGGFYSSLDADTPEGEGRYYVWHLESVREILSAEEYDHLQAYIQLKENGNFEEGLNILQYKQSVSDLLGDSDTEFLELKATLQPIFNKLLFIRSKRTPPATDKKIITAWNTLAIRAFAQAGLLLNRKDYLLTARNASNFILENLQTKDGHLQRSWNLGKANQPGTLADYSGMILALHDLYAVDFNPADYQTMQILYQIIKQEFSSDSSLYFDTASSVGNLIVRPQSLQDNATPSGNALAGHVHWLFANYEHDPNHFDHLSKMMSAVSEKMMQSPTGFGYWLQVADMAAQNSTQVALVSTEEIHSLLPFLKIFRATYRPHGIITANLNPHVEPDKIPELLKNRPVIEGKPTAYVCRGFTCRNPVTNPEEFQEQLNHELLS